MDAAQLVHARHAAAAGAALPGRAGWLAVWADQLAGDHAWTVFAVLNPTVPGARARRPAVRRQRLRAAEHTATLGGRAYAALRAENHPDREVAGRAVAGRARLAKQRRFEHVRQAGPPAWQTPTPAVPAATPAGGGPWWARAACRDLDPEVFAATTKTQVRRAKQVCAACPVQPDCLAEALAVPLPRRTPNQYDTGVVAGTTPAERARLRAATGGPDAA